MLELGGNLSLETEKGNAYHCLFVRHREQKYILKGFSESGCLLCALPLLKQGGEGGHIEQLQTLCVPHHNLSVASERDAVHIVPASGPAVEGRKLAYGDFSGCGGSGEDIVHSQGALIIRTQ